MTSLPPDFKNPLTRRRAVLTALELPEDDSIHLLLDELRLLLSNLDVETAAVSTQKRSRPDAAFLLGSGKVESLRVLAEASSADLIVSNDLLSPIQLSNIRKITNCEVWDRALVIMKIFERRAVTAEAKLQVELARCRYEMPHIHGLGKQMSNAGAGIGTRGPGETEFERHRRKLQSRIVDATRKLEEIRRRRQGQRKQRRRSGILTIALAGYTNSGKTTLLKRLSGDTKLYAADQLFATLDTAVRSIKRGGRQFLLADTVGFIRDLPPELIAAFRATLEEVCQADLIWIVLDVNDPDVLSTYSVIQQTLLEIGAASLPRTLVLNKIDSAGSLKTQRVQEILSQENIPVCPISALTGEGIDSLLDMTDWVRPLRDERRT
ncbi:MAG: GTPase HflX [Pyramidobacter sp.]|nr:GTPase HflX [Pyramidobacter sp.]